MESKEFSTRNQGGEAECKRGGHRDGKEEVLADHTALEVLNLIDLLYTLAMID